MPDTREKQTLVGPGPHPKCGAEYYCKVDNILLWSVPPLHKLFICRWKNEMDTDWMQTENKETALLTKLARVTEAKGLTITLDMINNGNIENWDLPTLSLILLNFGNPSKYQNSNDSVRTLTNIRNQLNSRVHKKLTSDEYHIHVNSIKKSLACADLTPAVISKIIDRSGTSSPLLAVDKVKKLLQGATQHFESGQFDAAIAVYNTALKIASVPPHTLSGVYRMRAKCYLALAGDEPHELHDKVLQDISNALQLNEYCWDANFVAAQCYRKKKDLNNAILHYEHALAISPGQKHVKSEWDSCKILEFSDSFQMMMDLRPTSLSQVVAEQQRHVDFALTEEIFIELNLKPDASGRHDFFRGLMYKNGWSVDQDFDKAFQYCLQAGNVGHSEALYNVGYFYLYGVGVKQDVLKSLEYFIRISELPPETAPASGVKSRKNVSIAGAQYMVAFLYQHGIGPEKDEVTGLEWFKKSAKNGNSEAALNVGLIYSKGLPGVPQNDKLAEKWWKFGLNLGNGGCALTLMNYYGIQMEPELMLEMYNTAKKLGHPQVATITEKEVKENFEKQVADKAKYVRGVESFEQRNNLDTAGLTFLERINRRMKHKFPKIEENLKSFKGVLQNNGMDSDDFFACDKDIIAFQEQVDGGSEVATSLVEAFSSSLELNRMLGSNGPFEEDEELEMISLLYKICTVEPLILVSDDRRRSLLQNLVHKLFQTRCGVKCEEDMKIRYCYVLYNLQACLISNDDSFGIDVINTGVAMYPDNWYYYDLLASCYLNKKNFKKGLQVVDKALQKLGANPDLLFAKAGFIKLLTTGYSVAEGLAAYEDFLKVAPPDHKYRPAAYYMMADMCLTRVSKGGAKTAAQMVRKYYNLGTEAEKVQVPFYLPYDKIFSKRILEMALKPVCTKERTDAQKKMIEERAKIERGDGASNDEASGDKGYLTNPVRTGLIIEHRKMLKGDNVGDVEGAKPKTKIQLRTTIPAGAKSIRITDFKNIDWIHENKVVTLKLIEEPCWSTGSGQVVGEDDFGDVITIVLYNVESELRKVFGYGSKIAILNPYVRVNDNKGVIRVDGVKRVVMLGPGMGDMCRFCGVKGATMSCGKCRRAKYCAKECQEKDWKLLKHKVLCSVFSELSFK